MNPSGQTSLGGPSAEFPNTTWIRIRAAARPGTPSYRQALDDLCRLYWKPAYAYFRSLRGLGNEEAKDLTQEFLLEAIEGNLFARVPPSGVSFRAYLRGALRLFLLERRRDAAALKRGGGRAPVSLDDADLRLVETLSVRPGRSPEEAFDGQWANAVLDQAVEDLRRELEGSGKAAHFRAFELYDLRPSAGAPTYAGVAAELGLKETDVTNYLSSCRRRLRQIVEARIRDTVSDDAGLAAELKRLFS